MRLTGSILYLCVYSCCSSLFFFSFSSLILLLSTEGKYESNSIKLVTPQWLRNETNWSCQLCNTAFNGFVVFIFCGTLMCKSGMWKAWKMQKIQQRSSDYVNRYREKNIVSCQGHFQIMNVSCIKLICSLSEARCYCHRNYHNSWHSWIPCW